MSKTLKEISKETTVSAFWCTENTLHKIKAPQGMMFKLKTALWVPINTGNNFWFIFDSELPDGQVTYPHGTRDEGLISMGKCSGDIPFQHDLNDYRCKYISIVSHSATPSGCYLILHYSLETASDDRIIYEYVKNARIR